MGRRGWPGSRSRPRRESEIPGEDERAGGVRVTPYASGFVMSVLSILVLAGAPLWQIWAKSAIIFGFSSILFPVCISTSHQTSSAQRESCS